MDARAHDAAGRSIRQTGLWSGAGAVDVGHTRLAIDAEDPSHTLNAHGRTTRARELLCFRLGELSHGSAAHDACLDRAAVRAVLQTKLRSWTRAIKGSAAGLAGDAEQLGHALHSHE